MKHSKSAVSLFTVTALVAALSGCAGMGPSGGMGAGDYNRGQSRQAQSVQFGTIEAIRHVVINGSTGTSSLLGTGVGAILGGVLGNQVGGGRGRDVATVLGAVGGGVAGNAIENHVNTVNGDEITVRLDSGRVIAVTQAAQPNLFRRGDRVQILTDNQGVTRVAPQ